MSEQSKTDITMSVLGGHGEDWGMVPTPKPQTKPEPKQPHILAKGPGYILYYNEGMRRNAWTFRGDQWI